MAALPSIAYVSFQHEETGFASVYVNPGGLHEPIRFIADMQDGQVTRTWVLCDLAGFGAGTLSFGA